MTALFFEHAVSKPMLVSFNGRTFDLRYIRERATVHGLRGKCTQPHLGLAAPESPGVALAIAELPAADAGAVHLQAAAARRHSRAPHPRGLSRLRPHRRRDGDGAGDRAQPARPGDHGRPRGAAAGAGVAMDVAGFLEELRASPQYADQIVFVREEPARAARYAEPAGALSEPARAMLASRGIAQLYCHQAAALDAVRAGENALIVTGTASGKSLCYQLPLIERLAADPEARALLLFPTKALCQDQFQSFNRALKAAGIKCLAGVYDGDTPDSTRRRLRDHASVLFTNPDMLHAGPDAPARAVGAVPGEFAVNGRGRAARVLGAVRVERGELVHAVAWRRHYGRSARWGARPCALQRRRSSRVRPRSGIRWNSRSGCWGRRSR